MSRDRRLKELSEAENDALHGIDKMVERWKNRITARNLRLADRFLELELQILLHLFVKETGIVWGVLLEKETAIGQPVGGQTDGMSERKEVSVLIDTVKLVDSPEVKVPAFVWFQPIHCFYDSWPDTLYYSGLTGFIPSHILRNREADLVCDLVPGHDDKLTRQMVKRRPEVVGNVPDAGQYIDGELRDCNGPIGGASRKAVAAFLSQCRVLIAANYVRVLSGEDVSCQVAEVLFGPLNFYADTKQSVVGSKRHKAEDTTIRDVRGYLPFGLTFAFPSLILLPWRSLGGNGSFTTSSQTLCRRTATLLPSRRSAKGWD